MDMTTLSAIERNLKGGLTYEQIKQLTNVEVKHIKIIEKHMKEREDAKRDITESDKDIRLT